MKTTIIIVTYNSLSKIKKNFDNLFKNQNLKIFIIDNNSTDQTVNHISSTFPNIKIFKQKSNLGYGRACNIGLKKVQSEYSLILNPDVKISYNDIQVFEKIISINQNVFLLGPTFTDDKYYNNNLINTNWISGCVMFINNKYLNKIGLFDENIFLFFEESDLCLRTINNKYLIYKCSDIRVSHNRGDSCENTIEIVKMKSWHYGWSWSYYNTKYNLKSKIALKKRYFIYLIKSFFYLSKIKKVKYYYSAKGVKAFINKRDAFVNGRPILDNGIY